MKVAKVWNDSVFSDKRQTKVKFKIYQDGAPFALYPEVVLESKDFPEGASRWEATIPVSPAIQSDTIVPGKKLNNGHEYTVEEYIWDETTDPEHPQWVKGNADFRYEFDPEKVTPVLLNGEMGYFGDADGDAALTGTNHVRSSVTITKRVLNKDGDELTADTLDEEFTFRITLKDKNGAEIKEKTQDDPDAIWYKRLKSDGTEEETATVINSGDTFTLKAGQSLRLINVPLGVKYKIEEISKPGYHLESLTYTCKDGQHETPVTQAPDASGFHTSTANTWHYVTAVNQETDIPNVSFDLRKVAKDTDNPLEGASFTIQQVKEESTTTMVQHEGDAAPSAPAVTGRDGMTHFGDIGPGFYEVKETKPPAGYITTDDAAFYIQVDGDGIHLLEKIIQGGRQTFRRTDQTKVGNVTYSTEGTTVVFIVENEPGAELPSTGGPGTGAFTMMGSMLLIGAGALLLRRRRTA